jgi:DNA-binding response OmpR family regulator
MTQHSPLRCLIVEDQALIGMSLEAYLAEAGFEPVGPFATNAEALRSIEAAPPDLAILDVLLKDGPCTPLIRELRRTRVPFTIYSGMKPAMVPQDLADVPWLEKPVPRQDLIDTLSSLARRPSKASAPGETIGLA